MVTAPSSDYDALVFAGGGALTVTYVGGLRYLEHTGVMPGKVRTFVGTSAGAMMALMCVLGMTSEAIVAWIKEHVESGDLTNLDIEGLLLLPERLGIDDGERVVSALRTAMRRVLRPGAGTGTGTGPYFVDPTFAELARSTGRNLVVCATNVTLERHEFFGVDTTPDVSVLTALRMSFSLPILFSPVLHRGCLYVDGGILDNVPVDFLVTSSSARQRTLVLSLKTTPPGPPASVGDALPSLVAYLMQMVQAVVRRANAVAAHAATDLPDVWRVSMDCGCGTDLALLSFDTSSMSFLMSPDVVDQQVQTGYEAMRCALSSESDNSAGTS